ncbi:MAG: penicillin-binding protein 2 [Proteobacteria bacterium]|nr:penicillin-binding protein 2 [Pseudomonadota bacterium]MBI3496586.1 penicillin-binding protein 2 [Pseudomonadota bacterium]
MNPTAALTARPVVLDRPEAPPPGRSVRFEGAAKQALEIGRNRLLVTCAVFALAFTVIGGRLIEIAVSRSAPQRLAEARRALGFVPDRAPIVDRNGTLLATSLPTASLYADPRDVLDAGEAAAKLASVLPGLAAEEIQAKLSSEKNFVWLKRNLTPRQQYEVNRLGIPGFYFQREDKRIYPDGSLFAHIVGFADVDGRGLAGLERDLDERLKSQTQPLLLTVDVRLQHILREELQQGIQEFSAVGGMGIVMDVRTGEILAMVSLPDFDPNRPGASPPENRFNRNTLGVYEMGSTFKIFNSAMALDSGTASLRSSYDARQPIRISRYTITDYHAERRWLTVPEIFKYSSNIGSAKMALDAGVETQRAFMGRVGFLKPVPIELKEAGKPLYPRPWRPINAMTIAFGHGLSVSPLHVAMGTAAVLNGGILRAPTLIRRPPEEMPAGTRILKQSTSEDMRRLFRLVVEEGTGKNAAAPGYVVGGKTGTAEKVGHGGYRHKSVLSSFIGVFPMHDPQYLVMVMVDEPKGTKRSHGYATGGWVAAPVVRKVITRMGPLYGIPPVDETSPEIRRALVIESGPQEKRIASQ